LNADDKQQALRNSRKHVLITPTLQKIDPMTPRLRYTTPAIALHWLLALMIIGSFGFGMYMTDLPFSPARVKLFNWHKWAGMTILALSALRLLWRVSHQPPALNLAMPAWQMSAYKLTHVVLYALFFAVPLAGWAYSSAAGFPIVVFGVLPLPDWVPKSKELADVLKQVHHLLAYLLAAFALLHIAAAIKHQWFDKDRLLLRMMPGRD
jgi:cytochrome b561